jgi:hypothetical protein
MCRTSSGVAEVKGITGCERGWRDYRTSCQKQMRGIGCSLIAFTPSPWTRNVKFLVLVVVVASVAENSVVFPYIVLTVSRPRRHHCVIQIVFTNTRPPLVNMFVTRWRARMEKSAEAMCVI